MLPNTTAPTAEAPVPAGHGLPEPRESWQPMSTAPTKGPVVWVEVWNGREVHRAHYAYGDGDGLMPPFGPAWFREVGTQPRVTYYEVDPQPTHWRPL